MRKNPAMSREWCIAALFFFSWVQQHQPSRDLHGFHLYYPLVSFLFFSPDVAKARTHSTARGEMRVQRDVMARSPFFGRSELEESPRELGVRKQKERRKKKKRKAVEG